MKSQILSRIAESKLFTNWGMVWKEMAAHSSVLAWRIPGTAESGGLPSMGSHRDGHDWSDLEVMVAAVDSVNSECCSYALQPPSHPLPTLSMHRVCLTSLWISWWFHVMAISVDHVQKEGERRACQRKPGTRLHTWTTSWNNSSMFLSFKHQEWFITQVHLSHSISLGLQLNTHRNTCGWYSSHITERVYFFCKGCHNKVGQTGWLKQEFVFSQLWRLQVQDQVQVPQLEDPDFSG